MSVITTDQIKGLMAPGIEDADLQGIIDREESWLATDRKVGIGQLVDERTQTVYRPGGSSRAILLPRPTDAVTVLDNGLPVDVFLLDEGTRVEPGSARWTGPTIALTYTPNDLLLVQRVIIELVRLELSASPYGQESAEGHSYSRIHEVEERKQALARSLHPHLGFTYSHATRERPLISSSWRS